MPSLYGINLEGTPYKNFTKESLEYAEKILKERKIEKGVVGIYIASMKDPKVRTESEKKMIQNLELNQNLKDNYKKYESKVKTVFKNVQSRNDRQIRKNQNNENLLEDYQIEEDTLNVGEFLEVNEPNVEANQPVNDVPVANDVRQEKEAPVKEEAKPDPYAAEKKEIEALADGILKDLGDRGIHSYDKQITEAKELCVNGDSSRKEFKDRLDTFKKGLQDYKETLEGFEFGDELLLDGNSSKLSKTISEYQEWALNSKAREAKDQWQIKSSWSEEDQKAFENAQKESIIRKNNNIWNKINFLKYFKKKNTENQKEESLKNEVKDNKMGEENDVKEKEEKKEVVQEQLQNDQRPEKVENKQPQVQQVNEQPKVEEAQKENKDLNNKNEPPVEENKNLDAQNNQNQQEPPKEKEADQKDKEPNQLNVQNENVQNIQNDQNLDKNKNNEQKAADAVKNEKEIQKLVGAYEEQLSNATEVNSVIAANKILKNQPELNRSESLALTENFDALQEGETAIRKAMPIKMEGPSISVPDLIKNQMLLNDGHMSPLQKLTHYNNIIQMKDMDGDKYSKQLMDYRLKVAEEAGKEFDKKHQDPTKLSFLNKSANAIETVMCAMSRNPLGIGILLVAALNAPLLIVGLLAFTAWKRKRPNPAYQQAWKEQTQRELAAKRQELANLYGRDPRELSDREVTKALRADYVKQKVYDALDAKLERDAQKTVDSATKKYAKAISKEAGEKFRSKDLRDHAEKELMRKKHKGETLYSMPTARENRLKEAINQHESKKGMGGRSI